MLTNWRLQDCSVIIIFALFLTNWHIPLTSRLYGWCCRLIGRFFDDRLVIDIIRGVATFDFAQFYEFVTCWFVHLHLSRLGNCFRLFCSCVVFVPSFGICNIRGCPKFPLLVNKKKSCWLISYGPSFPNEEKTYSSL